MSKEKIQVKEDEIDLLELAKTVWSKRVFIIKVATVFLVIGVVLALSSKNEFSASCKLMPESQEGMSPDLGGLGGLAGLAGINLNSTSSGSLTPELYPEIVQSSPFVEKLIHTPLYFEGMDTTISSFSYFSNQKPSILQLVSEYTIGLPGKLKKLVVKPSTKPQEQHNMMRFSKEEWSIMQDYAGRLSVTVDPETRIILVSTKMPDPVATAQLASILVEDLTNQVIKYKVEKEENNLLFVSERFEDAKDAYQAKQRELARFADRNRNISNSIVQTEYQRIQNELDILLEVYKGLATQLEQTRIKVKEKTPVFTILEPVKIPVERTSPNRKLVVLSVIFLGIILSTVYIVIKSLIKK